MTRSAALWGNGHGSERSMPRSYYDSGSISVRADQLAAKRALKNCTADRGDVPFPGILAQGPRVLSAKVSLFPASRQNSGNLVFPRQPLAVVGVYIVEIRCRSNESC